MTAKQNFPNDFLKLWQDGIKDYMQDARAAELMSEYFLKFQENFNSMAKPNEKSSTSEFCNDDTKGDDRYYDLSERIKLLEFRISKLEANVQKQASKSKNRAA